MPAMPVVLVHGAWGGAWAWGYVQNELNDLGITSTAIDLPSRESASATMADDAAAIRAAIEETGGPCVVVGHSYSGVPVSEATADNPLVAHIVYTCAVMPEVGQSTLDVMGSDPTPSELGNSIVGTDDGMCVLDPEGAMRILFNDVTEEEAAPIIAGLGPFNGNCFGEGPTAVGWSDTPSTYILATQDLVFSPECQRTMAQNATNIVEVDAGHIPVLSKAREVAEAIAAAAQS